MRISNEFEINDKLLIKLLNGTYEIDDSQVPNEIMQPVVDACKLKVLDKIVYNNNVYEILSIVDNRIYFNTSIIINNI